MQLSQNNTVSIGQKCLSGYLVYNALVDWLDTNKTKHYYGTCEKNFKERYNNHTTSFKNKNKEKSTKHLGVKG